MLIFQAEEVPDESSETTTAIYVKGLQWTCNSEENMDAKTILQYRSAEHIKLDGKVR